VDTTVTEWCDGLEKSIGDVNGSGDALWAGVNDFAFDGTHAVVVDIDILVAVGVVVGVDTVGHVGLVHGDEEVAVRAGDTARGETD